MIMIMFRLWGLDIDIMMVIIIVININHDHYHHRRSALDYSTMMPVLIKCAWFKVPTDHRDGDTAGASPSPNTVDAEGDDGGALDKSLQLGTLSHGVR